MSKKEERITFAVIITLLLFWVVFLIGDNNVKYQQGYNQSQSELMPRIQNLSDQVTSCNNELTYFNKTKQNLTECINQLNQTNQNISIFNWLGLFFTENIIKFSLVTFIIAIPVILSLPLFNVKIELKSKFLSVILLIIWLMIMYYSGAK